MHYLLIIFLILAISYLFIISIKLRRKIIIRAEVSHSKKVTMVISVILFFLLAFLIGRDNIVLYVISSLASILFILMITSQGLTENGLVYLKKGKIINVLKEILYDNFDSIELIVLEEFIILNYSFQEDYGQQIFSLDKRENISDLIRHEK